MIGGGGWGPRFPPALTVSAPDHYGRHSNVFFHIWQVLCFPHRLDRTIFGATGRAVALLDLKMPRMDGLEVLRDIRRDDRTRLIPVVILTSSLEEQDLLNGYGPGANSYVRKTRGLQSVQRGDAEVGTLMAPLERPPPGSGMGENSRRNPATGTPFSLTFLPLVHKLPSCLA